MAIIKLPTGTYEYDPSKPLGKRGGFGQVYAGKTASGGEVAVKKLHLSAADAAHRELRIADELKGRSFEHVIRFIDAGEDADTGDYFAVMPKAEGSLQSRVEKGGVLGAAVAAAILLQIVKGLIEVGELVHRDLKPDNILLHEGKWKIADFGIARFVEEATASNTLKDCLSPHYAAPEQWRLERATHATDVYSLGCVAYCLLTSRAPFLANPQEEHQSAPVPPFDCADPRLRSLIIMMMRKNPAVRPSLSRARELLNEVVAKPQALGNGGSLASLASVAAHVADQEQQLQAQQQAKMAAREARFQLAKHGFEILSDNVERLWGKIHNSAPNAQRQAEGSSFLCKLGRAQLLVALDRSRFVEQGSFPLSGWDIIAQSRVILVQSEPQIYWSASLWFGILKVGQDVRWHEVSYFGRGNNGFVPCAEEVGRDADLAASNVQHIIRIACGPHLVDDEHEEEFHERWIWLFSKAAHGKLTQPSRMPFNWPPVLMA
jgi:hypothetical protein